MMANDSRFRRRARRISWAAALVLACAIAPAAYANPLDNAKSAGYIGEQLNGFLGLVKSDAPADVVALVNEGHAVYYMNEDRVGEVGRYKVLLHTGNWSTDVVGCIAPGRLRSASGKGPMVTSSRATMKKVMEYIDGDAAVLNISWQAEEPA